MFQKAAMWTARKALSWAGAFGTTDAANMARLITGGSTYTGRTVDTTSAMQVTTVWCCVRIIAETLGMLPFHVMRREPDGSAVLANDHSLADVLIRSPNADMTSSEFFESVGTAICLAGNSYALKTMSGPRVTSLTPMPPDQVRPVRLEDGTKAFQVLDRGQWETVAGNTVWHVPGFGYNGMIGFSPIGYARQAIGLAMATEEFGARFFGQGARPANIVEIPDWLDDEKRKIAYERLDRMYAGLNNAHKTFILEGGMKHVSVTMPLDDAQFILTRKLQNAELCRIYRIPLHMVQEMEGSTNNNIEWQGQSLSTHTLLPYFTRIEKSVSKYLLTPADVAKGYFVRFNFEGLLRADTAARGEFYAKMLANGVYSRNEVRALENRPRVEGLDGYTVQVNMFPVDQLDALAASQIEK